MFKKIQLAGIIFLSCTSLAFADSFYGGPGALYQHLNADHLSYESINPTVFIGYQWIRENNFRFAAELFGSAKSIEFNHDDDDDNALSLKTDYLYGLSVLPAINLDNTLIGFLRLGYLRAKFSDIGKQEGTYQFGIGVETSLWGCWSARAEYDYVPFRSISNIGSIDGNFVILTFIYRMETIFE